LANETTSPRQYDEDGVRAPTEYKSSRLVDDMPHDLAPMMAALGFGGDHGGGGFGRGFGARPLGVVEGGEWMFRLNEGALRLNCGGDVAVARQRAKEEHKWLLVNLLK
jgi:hypothetical protein